MTKEPQASTDPAARFMRMDGGVAPAYNANHRRCRDGLIADIKVVSQQIAPAMDRRARATKRYRVEALAVR